MSRVMSALNGVLSIDTTRITLLRTPLESRVRGSFLEARST